MASFSPSKFFLLFFLVSSSGFCTPITAELRQKIRDAAARVSLDPRLVEAVVRTESNGNPNAKSPKGAMGLMQVMPQTADRYEIHHPYLPALNLTGACELLRELINRYQGNLKLALAAYNAGEGNVRRYGGIPPFKETREYVSKVLSLYKNLKLAKN